MLGVIKLFLSTASMEIEFHSYIKGYSNGCRDGTFVGFNHGYRQGLPPGRKRKKPNPIV
jgi:hypothetical protein